MTIVAAKFQVDRRGKGVGADQSTQSMWGTTDNAVRQNVIKAALSDVIP